MSHQTKQSLLESEYKSKLNRMGVSLDRSYHPLNYYKEMYFDKSNAKNKVTRNNTPFYREQIINRKRQRSSSKKNNKLNFDEINEEQNEEEINGIINPNDIKTIKLIESKRKKRTIKKEEEENIFEEKNINKRNNNKLSTQKKEKKEIITHSYNLRSKPEVALDEKNIIKFGAQNDINNKNKLYKNKKNLKSEENPQKDHYLTVNENINNETEEKPTIITKKKVLLKRQNAIINNEKEEDAYNAVENHDNIITYNNNEQMNDIMQENMEENKILNSETSSFYSNTESRFSRFSNYTLMSLTRIGDNFISMKNCIMNKFRRNAYLFPLVILILFGIVFFLNEKYFFARNHNFKKPEVHKKKIGKKAAKEAFEWVDAFVQAVFVILLLNIFIFQLYVIPSESMVDEFLIGDRVLVFKISSGPKFPMTKVGLKDVKKYERGDITVFHNPQYPATRQRELQNFYSQMVFMLTLTKVNLNVDENGSPMADPLVKRVCGVGGEQLVMLDGVLYHRTSENDEFTPVKEDSKWANWNLNELPNSTKVKVQRMPFTQKQYELLLSAEEERRSFDISGFASQAKSLSNQFASLVSSEVKKGNAVAQKPKNYRGLELKTVLNEQDRDVYNLFSQNELITQTLLSSEYGVCWFDAFMTDWISSVPSNVLLGEELYGGDMYTDSFFRANLMIKQCMGKIILANLTGASYEQKQKNFLIDLVPHPFLSKFQKKFLATLYASSRR